MATTKNVLLGVSGGIAAYKSADLVRRLKQSGCEVRVVMTAGATEFVTPLTFQALSGNLVNRDLFDEAAEAAMGHIELARWADMVIIAPATANCLARLAHGLADDLLTTVCLASPAPLLVAPAMNQQMWASVATQANVDILRSRDVTVLGPGEGEQACGDVGAGRMLEPAEIAESVTSRLQPGPLSALRVLITAGPTQEAIDPVRYVSNHSSGKMGYAVAIAALEAGADVTLVSGPTALRPPSGVHTVGVTSAAEMHDGVMRRIADQDIFIGAAAVADYRPRDAEAQKIKKRAEELVISMDKTNDILAEVASLDKPPFTVGFAAETERVHEHARDKLSRKAVDLIAANCVSDGRDTGFGADNNELEVFWADGHTQLPLAPKREIARALIALVAGRYHAQHSA